MTTDELADQRSRACGYSGCDRTVPYGGRGRPREYCDRLWPDGETCQQKAETQRAAAKAAGLDGPLHTYRQVTETLRPTLEGVAGQLSELLGTVNAVETGALVRITEAETAAATANDRATSAEHDRDTALSRAAVADRQRRDAVEAQRTAERLARDAQRTAEDTQQRAWREIAEHEHRRGQALAAADQAQANLAALTDRFDRLAGEHDALSQQHRDLIRTAAAVQRHQAVAETVRQAAQAAQAAAESERDRLATQLAEQAATARQRTADHDAEIARLRDEIRAAQARADAAPTGEQLAEMIRAAVAQPPATSSDSEG
jgi:chromosome segregation ATPase